MRFGRIKSVSQEKDDKWVVSVHDLSGDGQMREIEDQLPAPQDLGIEMAKVPAGEPLDVNLRLESVSEGVLVTGSVDADIEGTCSRCLKEISWPQNFTVQELVYYPSKDAEDDAFLVADDAINLEPIIREAIVLNLPFSPLCDDDCAGLCPRCGMDLNEFPDHVHQAPIDDRWSALKGLNLEN